MRYWDAQIEKADAALDAGRAADASDIARSTLALAAKSRNLRAEAKALACLANCDRLLSRFRRSHYASKRAAALFAEVGDVAGEAAALGTHAHAAAVLGRSEEAVEAGLLSVRLAESLGVPRPVGVANIQLGVAYFFGGSYERAHSVLEDALHLSKTCTPQLSPFQIRVTQGCAEVTRGINERCLGRTPSGEDRLRHVVSVGAELLKSGDNDSIAAGVRVSARALWFLVSATAHVWSGDLEQADSDLAQAIDWMREFGVPTSLDAFAELVRAERACAISDWLSAERHGLAAIEVATRSEHEEFAMMGFMVAGRAQAAQGKYPEALRMAHAMTLREQSIRTCSLDERTLPRRTTAFTDPALAPQ